MFMSLFRILALSALAAPATTIWAQQPAGPVRVQAAGATPVPAPGTLSPAAASAPSQPEPPIPQRKLDDPFFGDDEGLMRAAQLKAARAAVQPWRILARGISGERAVVILALDPERRAFVSKGDTITLDTPNGAMQLRLTSIGRQSLEFTLPDGTLIHLQ